MPEGQAASIPAQTMTPPLLCHSISKGTEMKPAQKDTTYRQKKETRPECFDVGLQAGVLRVSGFGPPCPHVPPQGDNQHHRRNQKKQERRGGPQAAEEEGMKEIEFSQFLN